MRQKNEDKVIEAFYEFPDKMFTIRDIAKLTGVPRASAHKILLGLEKDEMVTENNMAVNSLLFRIKKTNYYVEKIVSSGLIDKIVEQLNPSCIILFGSIRKGDSVKDSDIDLFIESSIKKQVKLGKFEKKLKHKIQLFIEQNMQKLNNELFNNVVNGIKLFGSFKIK